MSFTIKTGSGYTPPTGTRGRRGMSTSIRAALDTAADGAFVMIPETEITLRPATHPMVMRDGADTFAKWADRMQSTLYYPTDAAGYSVTCVHDPNGPDGPGVYIVKTNK